MPPNSNTTTATTAAQWDWKRHALTVPLEAFVMCDLSYRLVYKSNYQDDVQFPFETQVVRTTLFASHYRRFSR